MRIALVQERAGDDASDNLERGSAAPVPGPIAEAFNAWTRDLGVVVVLDLLERDGNRGS